MTLVLVNGNPETAAIWSPLITELGRDDTVTLSPPGFGAPLPDGFGATYDDYVAWLTGELDAIGPAISGRHPVPAKRPSPVGWRWGSRIEPASTSRWA